MSKPIMFSRADDLKGYVHYNVRCYFAEDVERLVEVTEALLIKCAENKGDITNSDFGKVWAALEAQKGE